MNRVWILAAGMAFLDGPYGPRIHACKNPLEGINLRREAELIRQKKSRLSANQRRAVMARIKVMEGGAR